MNPQNTMLSEEAITYCMTPFVSNTYNGQIYKKRWLIASGWDEGLEREMGLPPNGYVFLKGDEKKILKLVVMVLQHSEYLNNIISQWNVLKREERWEGALPVV